MSDDVRIPLANRGDNLASTASYPTSWTAMQRRRIAMNEHPATAAVFAQNGETCKTCTNFREDAYANRYHKCKLVPYTAGPGTDIKKNWPACIMWSDVGEHQADSTGKSL